MKTLIEALGWYGAIAIVVAYGLISFGILTTNDIWYQILNLTGAIGLAFISFYKNTYQPGVLNIVWILIALIAIVNILLL